MLLILDDSLIENISDLYQQDEIVSTLEEVALAFSKGIHLVFATRKFLNVAKSCELLSMTSRKAFRKLYEKHSQLGAYRLFFSRQLKLVVSDVDICVEEVNGIKCICVSVKYVRQRNLLVPMPLFLTENIVDSKLYEKLARVYLVRKKANIRLSFQPHGGGGSQIYNEYLAVQGEQNLLCLCVADSDMEYPDGPIGETARKLNDVADPSKPLCEINILGVREIENLLPMSALLLAVDGSDTRGRFLYYLEIMISRRKQYEHFIDFKSGMFFKSIYETQNEDKRAYWNLLPAELGFNSPCVIKQKCMNEKCECRIPGFGTNTLENVLSQLNNLTPHKFSEMINDELEDEYYRLGQIISAWFCAPNDAMRV